MAKAKTKTKLTEMSYHIIVVEVLKTYHVKVPNADSDSEAMKKLGEMEILQIEKGKLWNTEVKIIGIDSVIIKN